MIKTKCVVYFDEITGVSIILPDNLFEKLYKDHPDYIANKEHPDKFIDTIFAMIYKEDRCRFIKRSDLKRTKLDSTHAV
jgi:hypothetical protein